MTETVESEGDDLHQTHFEKSIAKLKSRVASLPPPAPAAPEAARQLPLFGELERAIPNHLARTALFSLIAPGRRKQLDRSEIAGREDVKILFTGKQLDMADCDVFMQALHSASKVPLGANVTINRGAFLKELGRSTGTSDYKWLHESFRRLLIGVIEIEIKNKVRIGGTPQSAGLHLISSYEYDPEVDSYVLTLDPRILSLFYNREYSLIDWSKRLQISKRIDMSKWLQNYLASHQAGPHKISLRLLKSWMDYSSPMNKFKLALQESLDELARLEIIYGPRIEMSVRSKELQANWIKH